MSKAVLDDLRRREHTVIIVDGYERALFGRGQIIHRLANGVYEIGSDPRADGCPLGW